MANTSGITSKAFEELQKSSEFKLRKGLKALQNSFTDLGAQLMDSLLPAITKILGVMTGLFKSFGKLSPETKQIAIAFGALAVVLPTVLTVLGSLGTVIAVISGPIGLLIGALGVILYFFDDIANATVTLKNALFENIGKALLKIELYFKKFMNVLKFAGKFIGEFSEKLFDGDFASISAELDMEQKKLADDINKRMDEHLSESMKRKGAPKYKDTIKNVLKDLAGDVGIKAPAGVSAPTMPSGPEKSPFSAFAAARMPQVSATVLNTSKSFNELNKQIRNSQTFSEKLGQFFMQFEPQVNHLAMAVGGTLMSSFQTLGQGGNFFDALIQGLKRLIITLAAAAAAAAILFVLTGGASAGGSSLGSFKTIFSSLSGLPEFANGGIVSGPTLGLMGEYTGARSNPEVIAPLDKLKGMIGQGEQNVRVGGEFRLQGQDLVVALQRAEKNRSRLL
jgi:hypothetical protein